MEHGHADAWTYPIGWLQDEARMIRQRIDGELARKLGLLSMLLQAIPNQSVNANYTQRTAKKLQQTLKELADGR